MEDFVCIDPRELMVFRVELQCKVNMVSKLIEPVWEETL